MIAKTHRWQKSALAAAATALLGLSGTGAHALSLGRLTVQSALGEPLSAEIDIPEISAEEASSLKAGVALPEAFTAAGMEYNPAMSGLQTSLQRRPDGSAYLRLNSSRTVNEPFVDLILEATWSQGRIVRDYTLLLDPPSQRKAATPAPTLAQAQPAPVVTNLPPKSSASASAPSPQAKEPARAAVSAPSRQAAPSTPISPSNETNGDSVKVQQGDTASKIANRIKPADVSLDQMLVAMLRTNPDAFIHDNLNRLRSGAVINVPKTELAQSVPVAEAAKIVQAQSKDFGAFRSALAANAPSAAVAAADRKSSGAIEATVDDKKPAAAAPDKLTLSKGAVKGKADEEAKIAKDREVKEAASRAAELTKNINELSKISAAAPSVATASAPASAPTVAVTALPAPAASAASAPNPAIAAASAPHPTASAPAKPKAPMPAPAPEEDSFLDDLLANPLIPAGGAGLIALIGGYAAYRIRQRKKAVNPADSAFLESRLQPDSFFGASGGQRIDTNQSGQSTASSMVYSASQLDAADDVDPVAEADVYLAYGRDLQAEEILKEAVRHNPGRLAIHTKLMEIFSKRRDARSFESSATQAYQLTGGAGPEWTRICDMGLAIDPTNPLYQPGGSPSAASNKAAATPSPITAAAPAASTPDGQADFAPSSLDLDLDLDFSADEAPTHGTGSPASDAMPAHSNVEHLDLDLDPIAEEPPHALSDASALAMPDISLSLDDLHPPGDAAASPDPKFEPTDTMSIASPLQTADSGMMEFDLGSLSMDLEPMTETPTEAPEPAHEDPLETKLALANEFISIGDEDGARALIEEVVAEATGELRAKAQRALAQLS